jgi:hypothetical protein
VSDELIARLRESSGWFTGGHRPDDRDLLLREAADRIEELDQEIERHVYARAIQNTTQNAAAALDGADPLDIPDDARNLARAAQVVVGDENKPTYHNLRSCPNAVSWCEGPDRYAGICNACLATWAEETRGTMPVAENPPV